MPSKSDRMRLNPPGHPVLPGVDSLHPRSSVWDGIGFLALAEVPGRLSSPSPALPVAGHPLSPLQRALLTPLLPRPSLPQTVPSQGTVSLLLPIAPPPGVNSPLWTSTVFRAPLPQIFARTTPFPGAQGRPVWGWSGEGGGRVAERGLPGEITASQLSGSRRGVISSKEPSSGFLQIWVQSPPPRIPDLGFSLTGALSAEQKPILIHIPHFNRA